MRQSYYPQSESPPPHLPPRDEIHRFPLRGCCACRTWSRLGDWNLIPPDTHEVCYACAHRYCDGCLDCWATPEENLQAAERRQRFHEEQEKKFRQRKEIAPWVAAVIERHDGIARRGDGVGRNDVS